MTSGAHMSVRARESRVDGYFGQYENRLVYRWAQSCLKCL
jgi:hypothetical protein